ncbi:MAG: HAD-IIA family hydrolase [Caldilineaceae bacterium]
MHQPLLKIDGFLFDLDGTVYLGEAAIPGAVEAIAELRHRHKKVLFVSNKPLEPRTIYAQKLTRLGIPTDPADVITSGYVLGRHLAQAAPTQRLYVIGEANLIGELRANGLTVVGELLAQDEKAVLDPTGIDAVVVSFDRTLDYRKLNTAYQALMRGAKLYATNGDLTCPMPGGAIPDAGATLAALNALTGRAPDVLAGKPSTLTVEVVMELMQLPPERCMMIGDRLETDIFMGQRAGMKTCAVLSGVSKAADVEKLAQRPDLVLNHIGELPAYIAA